MAFLLHVKYETENTESSDIVLNSLKVLAKHQVDKFFRGVITYHFTRPNSKDEPTTFEFTELYTNETQFVDHGKGTELQEHFGNMFNPKIRKSQRTLAFGEFKDQLMTKDILKMALKAEFKEYKGYSMNLKANLFTEKDRSPCFIKLKFTPNEGSDLESLYKEISEEFLRQSSPAIISLIIYKDGDSIYILETLAVEKILPVHWGSVDFSFLKKGKSQLDYYGNQHEINTKMIQGLSFNQVNFPPSEAGYIIHPDAAMTNFYDYTFSFCPKLKKVPSYEAEYLGQVKHWIHVQKKDINHKDNYERTMLSYACESNYLSVVKYLISLGAKIELDNYQPLCDAAHCYNVEMVKFLVENGADVNVKDYQENTPFHWILRCGKDDENLISLLNLFFSKKLDLTAKDHDGDSYLHLATRYGYLWTTRELVKLGANLKAKNLKGNTVLLNCCETSWGWNMSCFRFIFQKTGRIGLKEKNDEGNNALHIAARNGIVQLVRFLCSNVDINEKNNDGNTPLMEACLNNRNVTVVQHLISFGASLNVENNAGLSPLQLSLINFNLDIVYILLSRLQKKELVESISGLIPKLSEVVDEMTIKKINLDKVEKEEQIEK